MTQDNGMTGIECDCQLLIEECEYKAIQLIERDNEIMRLKERISEEIFRLKERIDELKDQRRALVVEVEELRRI